MEREDLMRQVISQEAQARHEAHKNHASSRPLSEDYELIGLLGELEFAQLTGQMVDLERRLCGDKGVDFVVPLNFSVDVKTARKAFHLIHEKGKSFADIYVLAKYDDEAKTTELLGWEWGIALSKAPVKDFGYGIENHYIPADKLRPMSELMARTPRYGKLSTYK
jgi:hypothetical protein